MKNRSHTTSETSSGISRRDFLKTTTLASAGLSSGLMASGNFAYAAGSDKIRVGLIGCGGRGTGAARDCVAADPSVEIYALGDLFRDKVQRSRELLNQAVGDRVNIDDSRCFDGFDNYLHVLDSGIDIALLAAPPVFRPPHMKAAVDRGIHLFMEKPVASDSAGVRSIIESGEQAKAKGLSITVGTIYRRHPSFIESIKRIHAGDIGKIVAAQEYYMTGPLWSVRRQPGMSDMEWQCRNWLYFTWLSGDHIVEQFVHNIDVIDWVFQDHPVKAIANGGRTQRIDPHFGHIYDHFSVEYEYANGARVIAKCRQVDGAARRVTNRVVGSEAVADLHTNRSSIVTHDGQEIFNSSGLQEINPFVQTHVDLIAGIRGLKEVNEARQMAETTLTGILGREAAYTGRELTWEEVYNADMDLMPSQLEFGAIPHEPVPVPGEVQLNRHFPDLNV